MPFIAIISLTHIYKPSGPLSAIQKGRYPNLNGCSSTAPNEQNTSAELVWVILKAKV